MGRNIKFPVGISQPGISQPGISRPARYPGLHVFLSVFLFFASLAATKAAPPPPIDVRSFGHPEHTSPKSPHDPSSRDSLVEGINFLFFGWGGGGGDGDSCWPPAQ